MISDGIRSVGRDSEGLKMGLVPEEVQLEAWEAGGRPKKGHEEEDNKKGEEIGCWIKFRSIGSCISARSKVDASLSSISTQCGKLLLLREVDFCFMFRAKHRLWISLWAALRLSFCCATVAHIILTMCWSQFVFSSIIKNDYFFAVGCLY